jgi:hypothetical protein
MLMNVSQKCVPGAAVEMRREARLQKKAAAAAIAEEAAGVPHTFDT